MPACETLLTCAPIGLAVIGTNFKIGCTICPIPPKFPADARMNGGIGDVKLYKQKFRKAGIRI